MICELVSCLGGGKRDFQNSRKKASRRLPFPDGVDRIITLSANQWAVFDRNNVVGSALYFRNMTHVLDGAAKLARQEGWTVEKAVQVLFRMGAIGIGQWRELGLGRPGNDIERGIARTIPQS